MQATNRAIVPPLEFRRNLSDEKRAKFANDASKSTCGKCGGSCCRLEWVKDLTFRRPLLSLLTDNKSGKRLLENIFSRQKAPPSRSMKLAAGKIFREEITEPFKEGWVFLPSDPIKSFTHRLSEDLGLMSPVFPCIFLSNIGCIAGEFRPAACWQHLCDGSDSNLFSEMSQFTHYEILVANIRKASEKALMRRLKLEISFRSSLMEKKIILCDEPIRVQERIEKSAPADYSFSMRIIPSEQAVSIALGLESFGKGNFLLAQRKGTLSFFKENYDQTPISNCGETEFGYLSSGYILEIR